MILRNQIFVAIPLYFSLCCKSVTPVFLRTDTPQRWPLIFPNCISPQPLPAVMVHNAWKQATAPIFMNQFSGLFSLRCRILNSTSAYNLLSTSRLVVFFCCRVCFHYCIYCPLLTPANSFWLAGPSWWCCGREQGIIRANPGRCFLTLTWAIKN